MTAIQQAQIEDLKKHLASQHQKDEVVSDHLNPTIVETFRLLYVAINRYKDDIGKAMYKTEDSGYRNLLSETQSKVKTVEDCLKEVMDCIESKA